MTTLKALLFKLEKSLSSKPDLDYFWIHSVRYKHILEKIEKLSNGKSLKILDIGCFPYHVGKILEDLGHSVYGIASEHEPIKNKRIFTLNIETERFPFENNFFDLVLCNEVVEHLPQSPVPVIKEMHRITKIGGHMMITTPNIVRSINRGKMLLGLSPMYPVDVYFEEDGKGNNIYHRHNREYTLSELKQVVSATPWKIEEANYFISYTPLRKRKVPDSPLFFLGKCLNYFLMLLVPSLQDTLMVIGRKTI